jgi:hypothetical protein
MLHEITTNKLAWTIIWLAWLSFPIFWYSLIVFLFFLLFTLQCFDFLTWYISARKTRVVLSKIWIDWMIKKSLVIMLCCIILMWASGLRYTEAITSDFIWLIPILIFSIFIFFEIISIFENLAVIFWNSRESKFFSLFSYLGNMLFNISIDKLKETAENRIKKKFNKE